MQVEGSAPTEEELRKDLELPASAKFKGWAVHTPDEGRSLVSRSGHSDAVVLVFGKGPEEALTFPSADDAGEIVVGLAYVAEVVAIFDLGADVAVIPVAGNEYSSFA